jgi:hypothetical protein
MLHIIFQAHCKQISKKEIKKKKKETPLIMEETPSNVAIRAKYTSAQF